MFARDLAECLRLQAAEQGLLTPLFAKVLDNLQMVGNADLQGLCRICGVEMPHLRAALRDLRGLDPKPGARFEQAPMPIRAPDLLVSQLPQGGWRLELNNSTMPAVMVRDNESRSMRSGADYHAERLSVARWLSRAVQYRNQTVLKIGEEILRSQRAFFKAGPEHLRPMIMKDIADAVGIHESTVSRVSNAGDNCHALRCHAAETVLFPPPCPRRKAIPGRPRLCAIASAKADPVRNADAAP